MTIITYKNRLPVVVGVGYISAAPHKTGAGFRSLLTVKAHNRASGFFTCKASSRLFRIMAGRTGEPQGSPGSLTAGTANLVRLATPGFAALGGGLSLPVKGATSWPTANHAIPTLTSSASTPRLKSIVAFPAQNDWRITCISSPSATTVSWYNCVCRQCSVIWQTTCRNFKNWWERRENSSPENLIQKQHSACWWGVCLSDIQEAL
ncbi:hypothetical protein CWD08_26275 [Salmonella enterica]|nr:hypothetical protein [Salmonella enterica]